ncbi:MAG: hypothetical protein WAZ50_00320 [Minisyncoccia bacterium]
MSDLDFLDEPSSDDARPAAAGRDEQGRFAAQEQAAPAERAPAQEPSAPVPPQEPTTALASDPDAPTPSGHVPLTALLDTRDKARQAEERARVAEERLAAIEAQRNQTSQVPDRYADPDAYDDWFQARLASQQRGLVMDMAELRAAQIHGADVVKAAREWGIQRCNEDPYFNQRMFASADPMGDVLSEYQKAQALSALDDPDTRRAFEEWQAGRSAAPDETQHAAPPPRASPPPRSLASAPAAGSKPGAAPTADGSAFDAVF